ncbi:neuferricin [Ctenocephalides felis]|uniref:neuferricin n=1 Tax=Ctenocephalides felis TaxID=7515 RepID=UPI000E6E458A|nr:neuferricin [Ctenocephalides felis]
MLNARTALFVSLTAIIIFYITTFRETYGIIKYVKTKFLTNNNQEVSEDVLLLSEHELLRYNGDSGSKGLYLSILGIVFDVEKGRKHYEPGGSYHVFAGRDVSKSFITGEFESDQIDNDVLTLDDKEIISLKQWLAFYFKEYKYVGKLIGQFYDNNGHKTDYLKRFEDKIIQAERNEKENKKILNQYPACNIEWAEGVGTKYWCTNRSGGQLRDWVGFPRQIFDPNSNTERCVCVQNPSDTANQYKPYANCDTLSEFCFLNN